MPVQTRSKGNKASTAEPEPEAPEIEKPVAEEKVATRRLKKAKTEDDVKAKEEEKEEIKKVVKKEIKKEVEMEIVEKLKIEESSSSTNLKRKTRNSANSIKSIVVDDALINKGKKISEILNELYPDPISPLHVTNNFEFLIRVILSAQTTDKKVLEVTPRLFKAAPDAQSMAKLEIDEIKEFIKEIGLSTTKAKNIHNTSKILSEKYDGEVPDTFEELELLPGVGHKTASIVMFQLFGKEAFAVDTHVHRLAKRWKLTTGRNVTQTEEDLKKIFPSKDWGKIELQMVAFGREHCPARNHNMNVCQICSWANK